MIKTMSHEQLTPLNSILNLSQYQLECLNGNDFITMDQQKYFMEVIWSSAKILEYGTQAQLTQMKIESNTYAFNYLETSRADLLKQA